MNLTCRGVSEKAHRLGGKSRITDSHTDLKNTKRKNTKRKDLENPFPLFKRKPEIWNAPKNSEEKVSAKNVQNMPSFYTQGERARKKVASSNVLIFLPPRSALLKGEKRKGRGDHASLCTRFQEDVKRRAQGCRTYLRRCRLAAQCTRMSRGKWRHYNNNTHDSRASFFHNRIITNHHHEIFISDTAVLSEWSSGIVSKKMWREKNGRKSRAGKICTSNNSNIQLDRVFLSLFPRFQRFFLRIYRLFMPSNSHNFPKRRPNSINKVGKTRFRLNQQQKVAKLATVREGVEVISLPITSDNNMRISYPDMYLNFEPRIGQH